MSGIDNRLFGECEYLLCDGLEKFWQPATGKIYCAESISHDGVSREEYAFLLEIEGDAAGRVAGRGNDGEGSIAKIDDSPIGEGKDGSWNVNLVVGKTECDGLIMNHFCKDTVALVDFGGYVETFQRKSVAESVVEVKMSAEQVLDSQAIGRNEGGECFALVVIIASAVDNDALFRIIVHDVRVLVHHVEAETFDIHLVSLLLSLIVCPWIVLDASELDAGLVGAVSEVVD